MNLEPVITRLKEVSALALVGGAADFGKAIESLQKYPAAFVLPAREDAEPNEMMSQLVQQLVTSEFAVVVAVRNLSDRDGRAAIESLEPVRHAVRDALLNWQPTIDEEEAEGCEFRRGEIVRFEASFLWWQDTYSTRYIIRSV